VSPNVAPLPCKGSTLSGDATETVGYDETLAEHCHETMLAPARGIIVGVMLGTLIWLAICIVLWLCFGRSMSTY
jgi:hypothetical protein